MVLREKALKGDARALDRLIELACRFNNEPAESRRRPCPPMTKRSSRRIGRKSRPLKPHPNPPNLPGESAKIAPPAAR